MKSAKDLKKFKYQMQSKKRSTPAELLAKSLLAADNRDFKHQCIIGFYIVDFVIPNKMLVVELDGKYHSDEYQQWYDKRRDIFLSRCQFRVLRMPNEEAVNIIEHISRYPNIVDWEKKFRHGLSFANQLKGKEMQRNKYQTTH